VALRKRGYVGALAAVMSGLLVFSGVSPAVADEFDDAPIGEIVTAESPEADADIQPPGEEPTGDDAVPQAPEGEAESLADAPLDALAEPLEEGEIAPLAIECVAWPAVGSPVAGFEIDGNLCLNSTMDWATVGGQPVTNDGYGDATQFTRGASEGNWPWSEGQISGEGTAAGQADIGNVYAFTQTVGGEVFAYLGFERAATTGTIRYFVELNKLPNHYGPVADRSVGDLRLDIQQHGNNLLSLEGADLWNGAGWTSLGSAAGFVGQAAEGPVENLSGEVLTAGAFAELAVNLTALFGEAACGGGYGVLNIRSTSSTGGNPALADWVAPISLTVPSTCGTLEILKTDTQGSPLAGAEFQIAPNPATGTGVATATTGADGRIVLSGIEPGTYTVTETLAPPGYLLDSTPQQATVGRAQTKTLTFVDPLGDVDWQKRSADGRLLGGATFSITATGGPAAAAPWAERFPMTVVDNGLNDADPQAGLITVVDLPIGTFSVSETVPPANYVLDPTPKTFAITQEAPHAAIATAFVNVPYTTVVLSKRWVDSFPGDQAQLSIGGAAIATGSSTAPTTGPAIQVAVAPGSTLTVSEVLAGSNTGVYASTLVCDGALVRNNTGTSATVTVPEYDDDDRDGDNTTVRCLFTNTAVKKTVTLQKRWIDGIQGDTAQLRAGPATSTSTADGSANQLDQVNVAQTAVRVGDTVAMSETLAGAGSYGSTYACTAGAVSGTGVGTSFTLTVPNADVVCTFTNTANRGIVSLTKTWVNGQAGDTADLTITAGSDSGMATSTSDGAVGSWTDAAHTATAEVIVGETVSVEELIEVVAGAASDYSSSLVCVSDGQTLLAADARSGSFTMPDGDVQCEFVNAAERPTLALVKTVTGAEVDAANWQLIGTPVTGEVVTNPAGGDVEPMFVVPGADIALSEQVIGETPGLDEFAPGLWSCVSADGAVELIDSVPGVATLPGLDKGEHVVCTIDNAHVDQGYTFDKSVVDSVQNEDGTWTVTYEITVHNNSVVVPITYQLIDTLADPADGIAYLGASWTGPTSGEFDLASSLTAVLADGEVLEPFADTDAVYTVVVDVDVSAAPAEPVACDEGGTGIGIVNTAALVVGVNPPVLDDACGTVEFDDVEVVKTATGLPADGAVASGTAFAYVLTVTNHGTRDAQDVVVTDALPAGVVATALELPGGWVNDNAPGLVDGANTVRASTATLAAGESAEIVVNVVYRPSGPLPTELVNTACVAAARDQVVENDCSDAVTPVTPEAPVNPINPVKPVLPATGGGIPSLLVALGLLAAISGATIFVIARRRREVESVC